jgi:hypothetical protein
VKEAQTLISLSGGVVSLHDDKSLSLLQTLPQSKNASAFAVTSNVVPDADSGVPEIISRLAVAVKRKLYVWSWHEGELGPDVGELSVAQAIRSLTWVTESKIVVGMNSGFVLVDVLDGSITDVVGPGAIGGLGNAEGGGGRFGGMSGGMGYMGLGGYAPKPLATRLREGEALLAKDINSLFITADGKPQEKRQIPWAAAPEAVGYSYPYILALQAPAKGSLEVRNPETLNLLQSISLPDAKILHLPPSGVSLAHFAKGFHAASDRVIWKLQSTSYDAQIDELVSAQKYDEAISVLEILEDALLRDKEGRIREVKMLKAQTLFDARRYRESLDLFTEVAAPPERVVRLYPKVIAGELSTIPEPELEEDSGKEEAEAKDIPKKVDSGESAAASLVGSPMKGFVPNFMKAHKKTTSVDAASIRSSKPAGGEADKDSDTASLAPKIPKEEGPLEGKDLEKAVLELNAFLVDTRNRLKAFVDPVTQGVKPGALELMSTAPVAVSSPTGNGGSGSNNANGQGGRNNSSDAAFQSLLLSPSSGMADIKEREAQLLHTARLVDTTLFRAYMLVRPYLAGSLFRIPNFCDPDVVGEKLREKKRYNDLVDFLSGKGLHREALTLLRDFGNRDTEDVNEDGEIDEVDETLRGPGRTVGYLQSLNSVHIDLILEFSKWVLEKDSELGMQIFLADSENAETLPRDRVLHFLEGLDGGEHLARQYVEHIVEELGDATPDFHDRLVASYVHELSPVSADQRNESWHAAMARLISFLGTSKQYSLSKAFALIPRDDKNFYEAQAVVLKALEQHRQALEIYVFKLKDYAKAEEYCNAIHLAAHPPITSPTHTTTRGIRAGTPQSGRTSSPAPHAPTPPPRSSHGPDTKEEQTIYTTLLSLYLNPPRPYAQTPVWAPALDLLSKHGSRLPADAALKLLPASIKVSELEAYFRGRIRAGNERVSMERVESGLRKVELIRSQEALLIGDGTGAGEKAGLNRSVVVGEERVCGVCHKRLGRSVVALLPQGGGGRVKGSGVVHYGCLGRVSKGGLGSLGMEGLRRVSGLVGGTAIEGKVGRGW